MIRPPIPTINKKHGTGRNHHYEVSKHKPNIHQIEALQYLTGLEKFSVILNSPVGYGKSLVYQIYFGSFMRWESIYEALKKGLTCLKEKAGSLVITPLNIIQTDVTSLLYLCLFKFSNLTFYTW